MPKITKTAIDQMSPDPSRERYLWDSALSGFGVRMMSSGVASFIVKYRTRSGDFRRFVIGRVGTITADEARKEAIKALAEVAKGGDPSEARKAARTSIKLKDLADLFVADKKARWKPNTYLTNTSQIETHLKPLIGHRTAISLSYSDVAKLQADIIAGKTSKKRVGRGGVTTGGKGVANRTIMILGAILNHGIQLDILNRNVAERVKKTPVGKRTRFLSFVELRKIGEVLKDSPAVSASGLNAIRFLLLTGFRRNEALNLTGDCCSPMNGTITLKDSKTGAQVRVAGKAAFDCIDTNTASWLFPALRGPGHFVGIPKCLGRICNEAAVQNVSAHTLRHTFAAVAATMGYSELTIAGLLGHSSGSVTARYAHIADAALLSAANRVSDIIARALDGENVEREVFPDG